MLTLLLTGCGSADVEPGAWRPGEEWRLTEETRIGAADGNGPGVFGNVVAVALDPMGRMWVADGQQQHIEVFDPTGGHVRTVGRKGRGPSEFAGIAGMDWSRDGTLWVRDGGNSRFAVFDTAGKLVDTRPHTSSMTMTPWPGRFDTHGRLYDVAARIGADASIGTSIVRFDSTLQAVDTFQVPPFKPEVFEIVRGDARNRVVTQVNVPFTGDQVWRLDPEGNVWIANTARYRIERHAFTGGVDRVVERRVPPVAVSRAERDRMLEGYESFIRQGGKVDLDRIPETAPPLINFLFDDAGYLWASPATPSGEGRALDVFEPGGRFLGRVAFPAPRLSSPRAIRDGRMAVVARDSLDVPQVIVLRVIKPGA